MMDDFTVIFIKKEKLPSQATGKDLQQIFNNFDFL